MQSITYLGTADDVVRRYPWQHGCSIESINHQLIHSVIYNQKLAINDGYIVANPELITSLNCLSTSLLGNALTTGAAVLFSRSSPRNLADGIRKSAQKIQTHRNALEGQHGKNLIGNLETLQKYVLQFSLQWPKNNMGGIFAATLGSLAGTPKLNCAIQNDLLDDFESIYKRFELDMNVNYNEARQHWERLCWRHFEGIEIDDYDPFSKELMFKKNYSKIRTLMQVANEAYHMAYSCALDWSIKSGVNEGQIYSVKPLTAFCPAYFDLFQKETLADDQDLQFKGFGKLLISVKPIQFKADANYSWLNSVEKDSDCRELRNDYLKYLDDYLHYKCTFESALNVAQEYKKNIASLIKLEAVNNLDPFGIAVNFFASNKYLSAIRSTGQLSRYLSVSEPTNINILKSVKRILEFPEKIITGSINKLKSEYIIKKLEDEGMTVSRYGEDRQMARDLGLINAPLDSKKVASLVEPIKPWDPKIG